MRLRIASLGAAMLLAGGSAWAAGKPHEHGAVSVAVAVEAAELGVEAVMPLDDLLGFERAPRSEAERKAAAHVLERLRAGADLFRPDPAARCTLSGVEVEAPVLEPARRAAASAEHAELSARYRFTCANAARLAALEIRLFDAFPRIRRIEVQVAAPHGQSRTVLRPPARQVRLAR